jgi:uncharacterized membrane protein
MAIGLLVDNYLLWLGILVLILTPFLRVVITGLVFLSKHEIAFFLLAMYVILVLVISAILNI